LNPNPAVDEKLRIGVVGGGAVAERVHLPALACSSVAEATVLVEKSAERATQIATQFRIPQTTDDYRAIIGRVDAAIIGLPHQMHAPVAVELMQAGIHVLVEKPMALSAADCALMNETAARTGRVLTVGLLRRCAPSLRWIKNAIASGMLGTIDSFEIREGGVYRWPVASPSMFRPEGGGVLADAGSHVLDLVLWWFGDWRSLRYRDDAQGGVEADCLLEIEMHDGARGRIELSRTRSMPNECVIRGEHATIEVGTKTDSIVTVTWRDRSSLSSRATAGARPSPTSLVDLFTPQFEQFVRAIRFGEPPVVSGAEAQRSIELLNACYSARERWSHPWDAAGAESGAAAPLLAGVAR
jgi:predicted dehydrogenase